MLLKFNISIEQTINFTLTIQFIFAIYHIKIEVTFYLFASIIKKYIKIHDTRCEQIKKKKIDTT